MIYKRSMIWLNGVQVRVCSGGTAEAVTLVRGLGWKIGSSRDW